ncbi:MAG TPA: hypothetical protein VME46_15675 [Acidimicrobiales bacterium]|nr:hypothetical protein [Acidimicrobiales bacterium]
MGPQRPCLAALSVIVVAAGLFGANLHARNPAGNLNGENAPRSSARTAVHWAAVSTFPQTISGFGDVSCASSTCVAVGIMGMALAVSQDNGMSWSSSPVPAGVTTLQSVSCASRSHCTAVGEYLEPAPTDTRPGVVVVTDDGGRSWTRQATTMVGPLVGVSCENASSCVAIGSAGLHGSITGSFALTTANAGRSWASAAIAGSALDLSGVSCPSAQHCVAVGSVTAPDGSGSPVAMVTTDGGARWHNAPVPSHDIALYTISCPTDARCVATGMPQLPTTAQPIRTVASVFTSADGGARWSQRALPPGAGVGAVTCLPSGWCLLTGANAPVLSTDYGEKWTMVRRSLGFSTDVTSVACRTASSCVAVGGSEGPSNGAFSFPFVYPTVATSSDGGRSWAPRRPPEGWLVNAMACPARRRCVAVGTTNAGTGGAWASDNFGRNWVEATVPGTVQVLNSLSCPSPSACVAVGSTTTGSAVALSSGDGGASWALSQLPKGLASLASVSCTNAQLCVGVGSIAVHYSVPPGGHQGVGDIESGSGALITSDDGGTTWVNQTRTATREGYVPYFFSVSCLPSGFCATGPSYGRFLSSTDGGRTWADVKNFFGYFPTTGLSCMGPSTCVADSTDQASAPQLYRTVDDGRSWSEARLVSAPAQYAESTWQLGAPICSTEGLCLAVGGDTWYGTPGLALVSRDGGRSWATTTLPPGSSLLSAAACTGTFTCLVAAETHEGEGIFIVATLSRAS